MFFSKNILFYIITYIIINNIKLFLHYYYYFIIFYFLYSTDCKCEYFCTTSNKSFKCVSFKSIFFKLTDGISHVLVDRLTWNLEDTFTECIFIAWTTDFKIWCFFLFLFTTQKAKSTKKIDILTSKLTAIFSIFEISLFQWFML